MPLFRKRTYPFEAIQWNGNNLEKIKILINKSHKGQFIIEKIENSTDLIYESIEYIKTGMNRIKTGDWISLENDWPKYYTNEQFIGQYEPVDEEETLLQEAKNEIEAGLLASGFQKTAPNLFERVNEKED